MKALSTFLTCFLASAILADENTMPEDLQLFRAELLEALNDPHSVAVIRDLFAYLARPITPNEDGYDISGLVNSAHTPNDQELEQLAAEVQSELSAEEETVEKNNLDEESVKDKTAARAAQRAEKNKKRAVGKNALKDEKLQEAVENEIAAKATARAAAAAAENENTSDVKNKREARRAKMEADREAQAAGREEAARIAAEARAKAAEERSKAAESSDEGKRPAKILRETKNKEDANQTEDVKGDDKEIDAKETENAKETEDTKKTEDTKETEDTKKSEDEKNSEHVKKIEIKKIERNRKTNQDVESNNSEAKDEEHNEDNVRKLREEEVRKLGVVHAIDNVRYAAGEVVHDVLYGPKTVVQKIFTPRQGPLEAVLGSTARIV